VAILAALFAVQQRGTAVLGRFLGPVMAIWFTVLALLGLWGIAQYPAVLWALNPALGLHFLFSGGGNVMLVLGGVFLCVTGAEALYADLGHFGRAPIRLGWCVVFPALVLNYAGQAAIVLAGGRSTEVSSSASAPRRCCCCRWSYSPRLQPPSRAKRSSRVPSR
jgi:K+ transporter